MDEEDYYPLFNAIEGGDVAAVESFLQTPGIDVDFAFEIYELECHYTPLNWAIRRNHQTIVEVLLAHGAAVNGPVGAWMTPTPLQEASELDAINERVLEMLLEHGANLDAMTADRRMTPLTIACGENSNLGTIQLLLNAGADVNGGGGEYAPLHSAAYFGNQGATQLLIEAGADVNRVSTEVYSSLPVGSTSLHFTAADAQLDCLNILLEAGADPNIANEDGQTPLYHAACIPFVQIVNALLAAGCDPLHRDNYGRTPLQHYYYQRRNRNFSADLFNIIIALVAAGDRSWECVPTPCPGLEAAMVSVWQAAPDEMPELVKRLDEEMKKVVQEVLRVLHRPFSSFPHLKEHLLKYIFGFTTSV